MDKRYFDELTPDRLNSLFIRLMRGYKGSLSPELSHSREYGGSPLPVIFTLFALGGYFAPGDRSAVVEDDGEMLSLDKYLIQAIENGTNPNHPGYWNLSEGRGSRTMPELAASVAFAAYTARQLLFRRLSNQSIVQLEQWLENAARIKVRKRSYLALALALNHAARKGMGLRHDDSVVDGVFEAAERTALEEGWFAAGGNGSRQFDDTVSWGYINLLSVLLFVEGGKRSARYAVWEPRIRKTLRDFPYLFDPAGGTPAYGDPGAGSFSRLTGPLAGQLIGAWPGKPGLLKRMVRLHLNRLMSTGVIDVDSGRLSPPGGIPATGGHFRAMQGLGLMLLYDRKNSFWSAKEEPLPVEKNDFVRYVVSPGWMIHGARQDSHVQLINGGSRNENKRHQPQIVPRYGKFSYSSRMGLVESAAESPLAYVCDNTLSASGDKKSWSHRDKISASRIIGDRVLYTAGPLPVALERGRGGMLKTETLIIPLRTGAHIRIHRVRRRGIGGGVVHLREGGYALGINEENGVKTSATGNLARAEGPAGFSLLRILSGFTFAAISQGYENRSEGHSQAPRYLLPRVETILRPGETLYLALFVHGGGNINLLDSGASVSFARKGDRCTLLSGGKSFFDFDFQSS